MQFSLSTKKLLVFQKFFYRISQSQSCTRKTTAEAPTATFKSPWSKYASPTAATVPAQALSVVPVAEKIAGKVIAASTEYGT